MLTLLILNLLFTFLTHFLILYSLPIFIILLIFIFTYSYLFFVSNMTLDAKIVLKLFIFKNHCKLKIFSFFGFFFSSKKEKTALPTFEKATENCYPELQRHYDLFMEEKRFQNLTNELSASKSKVETLKGKYSILQNQHLILRDGHNFQQNKICFLEDKIETLKLLQPSDANFRAQFNFAKNRALTSDVLNSNLKRELEKLEGEIEIFEKQIAYFKTELRSRLQILDFFTELKKCKGIELNPYIIQIMKEVSFLQNDLKEKIFECSKLRSENSNLRQYFYELNLDFSKRGFIPTEPRFFRRENLVLQEKYDYLSQAFSFTNNQNLTLRRRNVILREQNSSVITENLTLAGEKLDLREQVLTLQDQNLFLGKQNANFLKQTLTLKKRDEANVTQFTEIFEKLKCQKDAFNVQKDYFFSLYSDSNKKTKKLFELFQELIVQKKDTGLARELIPLMNKYLNLHRSVKHELLGFQTEQSLIQTEIAQENVASKNEVFDQIFETLFNFINS